MSRLQHKIVPHLWFDKEAQEAAAFYGSVFPRSKTIHVTTLRNTPAGDCDVVSFSLWDHPFMAISAGPLFKFNPSVSFIVNFDPRLFGPARSAEREAREKLDAAWSRLSQGGTVLQPLQEYPFSKRYGWVQDRYGLSWQLILTDPAGEPRPAIVPALLFVAGNCGKAEEAIGFYCSIFKHARLGRILRFPKGMAPEREGTVMFADFMLEGQWFAAMDSAQEHRFNFNEAVSFMVNCATQQEIDGYWETLSAVPEAEQCGWIKDRYGLSWQITPQRLGEMLSQGTRSQIDRVTQTFLPMKKLVISELEQAYARQ
jgi:predicted 3-demethylubiquinone-9 3-methyltransferase (glyoxalase superfamily)